ncbi:MAG: hypothetical protein ACRDZ6_02320 [Acidimicrobiales bacterium]
MTSRRVYVAHPMLTYDTEWEASCLRTLAGLLPHVELYNPAGRYLTDASWLRAWPRVLRSLSGLVVFGTTADDDYGVGAGEIGTGCIRELGDAIACGVPLLAFDGERLHELDGVRLLAIPWRSARRAGALVLGPVFEPNGAFPSVFDGARLPEVAR